MVSDVSSCFLDAFSSNHNTFNIWLRALVELKYSGHKRSILALVESDGFVALFGCFRVELHDKVIDGVNYHGKVFVRPLFRKAKGAKRPEQRLE